jgi:hypothetical protein
MKHVHADVAAAEDVESGAVFDAECVERRPDQLFLHPFEVEAVLRAERPDDECAGNQDGLLGGRD